jgi:hypothetical protein
MPFCNLVGATVSAPAFAGAEGLTPTPTRAMIGA